jgi:type IV secretory pathway TrbL component
LEFVSGKRKKRFILDTEDILAIGAVIVAIIIANGIVQGKVDVTQGGMIIGALVGGAAIAQVLKAKRKNIRK